jgi:UDP-N-acetylmuramate--alanine ligase
VVTNIDREHMEAYGGFDDLQQAFVDFANKVPFYGVIIACADDLELARLLSRMTRRVITYGCSAEADLAATEVQLSGFGSRSTVVRRSSRGSSGDDAAPETLGTLRLQVPGRHSVLNARAAIGVGLELGVPFEVLAAALADFQGAERRFERRGVVHGITVVDDYGHHPTEIAAVLDAARAAAPTRVIVAFQPHRYTRTARLMPEFAAALSGADEVVLTDIYAAGEEAIPGVDVDALAAAADRRRTRPVTVVRALDRVAPTMAAMAAPGDLVITLGAGSIGGVAQQVVRELERLHGTEPVS